MDQPTRALLYARVSKADRSGKRETTSCDQQLDHGRRRAVSQNWAIVGELRDDGVSASRYATTKIRPDWQRAVEVITARECNVVVLWEVSRATRDRLPYAALIAACIDAEVWIDVGGRLHDPSDPDDGFMLDLQAGLAVRESGVTSKRIRRDVAARAEAGTPHGKLPYGYIRTYEQRTRGRVLLEQIPDPETAPVVAEIAERLIAGESAYAIACDLQDRAIPSPETIRAIRAHGPDAPRTPWRLETVRDLALSPTLAGQRVHQGRIIGPAAWKAIISPADHLTLTALLQRTRRHRPGTVQHLLSGIAVCGICSTPLRHIVNRTTASYYCPGPMRRGDGCVSRVKAKVDALVTLHVVRRLADPGLLADLARSQEGATGALTASMAELADLQDQLAAFVAAAAEGKVSAVSFGSIEAGLQRRIDQAKQRIPRADRVPPLVLSVAGPDAERRWDGLNLEARRQIIRFLVTVVVHRTSLPKGSRVFDGATVVVTDLV